MTDPWHGRRPTDVFLICHICHMLIFSHISLSMLGHLGPCHNLSRPVILSEQKETDGAGAAFLFSLCLDDG